MSARHPRVLDDTFKISLTLKGLDGLLELAGGFVLLFLSPHAISSVAKALTEHELSQDPQDFIANHLLHFANHLSGGSTLFGALYLLSHGVVKILLVVAVLKNKLWAYPWMIGFIAIFAVYQIYRLAYRFSLGLLLLTLFDLFIIWLTAIEYRRNKHKESLNEA